MGQGNIRNQLPKVVLEIFSYRSKLKIGQHLAETSISFIQVDILAETGAAVGLYDPGTIWIQFPGMEVDDGRITIPIEPLDSFLSQPVRVETEITAPGKGDIISQEAERRGRDSMRPLSSAKGWRGKPSNP
jgi:hypothetical protein